VRNFDWLPFTPLWSPSPVLQGCRGRMVAELATGRNVSQEARYQPLVWVLTAQNVGSKAGCNDFARDPQVIAFCSYFHGSSPVRRRGKRRPRRLGYKNRLNFSKFGENRRNRAGPNSKTVRIYCSLFQNFRKDKSQ
jgi:hypothetical protein